MSAIDILVDTRAAARTLLTAVPMPTITLDTIEVSNRTVSSENADFAAAGFSVGDRLALDTKIYKINKIDIGSMILREEAKYYLGDNYTLSAVFPAIAYEGETYQPTPGLPFLTETLKSSGQTVKGIGGITEHIFLYALTLQYPANEGTIAIEKMAGRLFNWFKPGVGVPNNGQHGARIENTSIGSVVQDKAWISLPILAKIRAWSQ